MSVTTSLTPALSPRRGRNVRRVLGNTSDWIGRTAIRRPENVIAEILSPGERTQVRAVVHPSIPATLQNAVTATDQQIDQLVYELYGLTEEEKNLVEGAQ